MSGPIVGAVTLDHVGIVASTELLPLVALLGNPALSPTPMPSGVSVARFGPAEMLELVWPRTSDSPVAGFLADRGPGLHHVALAVEVPLAGLRSSLTAAGVRVVGGVEPSSDGRPSLFIHPSSTGGVLVELVQGRR